MGKARFVYRPEVEAELLRDPAMGRAMLLEAERVAQAARSNAPVRTGAYRDSIKAEPFTEGGVHKARVNAYDFKAWWIEFGTGHPGPTPAFAVLAKGVQQAGLRYGPARGI